MQKPELQVPAQLLYAFSLLRWVQCELSIAALALELNSLTTDTDTDADSKSTPAAGEWFVYVKCGLPFVFDLRRCMLECLLTEQ